MSNGLYYLLFLYFYRIQVILLTLARLLCPTSWWHIGLFTLWYMLVLWFRRARSQSCPFCRDSLKRVNSNDLWIYTCRNEVIDLSAIARENLRRLIMYIEKLPLIVVDPVTISYEPCYRWWCCSIYLRNHCIYVYIALLCDLVFQLSPGDKWSPKPEDRMV